MNGTNEMRKIAIERAKEAKERGGVGAKTAGLTNKHDPLVSTSHRTSRILRSIS